MFCSKHGWFILNRHVVSVSMKNCFATDSLQGFVAPGASKEASGDFAKTNWTEAIERVVIVVRKRELVGTTTGRNATTATTRCNRFSNAANHCPA